MSTLSDQLGLGATFRPGPFGFGEQTSPFPEGSQGEKFFNSLSNEDKAAINTYVYRAKQKDPSSDGITGKEGILFALSNNPQYAAQALNYGPPRDAAGNVIPDKFVQSMRADTTPGYTGPSSGSSAFAQMLPFLTAYFLPGIGDAITEALVSSGVVTAGATANALGLAMAKTAAGVAQGQTFEDSLKNAVVDAAVNVGSIEVAKGINNVISNPAITNAIVSTGSSMLKTAASGGSEADISKAGWSGLASSVITSAAKDVFNTSSDTANIFGAAAGGAVTGGTTGAITGAINTGLSQAGTKKPTTTTDATTTKTSDATTNIDPEILKTIAALQQPQSMAGGVQTAELSSSNQEALINLISAIDKNSISGTEADAQLNSIIESEIALGDKGKLTAVGDGTYVQSTQDGVTLTSKDAKGNWNVQILSPEQATKYQNILPVTAEQKQQSINNLLSLGTLPDSIANLSLLGTGASSVGSDTGFVPVTGGELTGAERKKTGIGPDFSLIAFDTTYNKNSAISWVDGIINNPNVSTQDKKVAEELKQAIQNAQVKVQNTTTTDTTVTQ